MIDFGTVKRNFLKNSLIKLIGKKYNVISAYFAVALIAFGSAHIYANSARQPAFELYVDGNKVGCVRSAQTFAAAKLEAEEVLMDFSGVAYRFPAECATYKPILTSSPEYLSVDEIKEFLINDAKSDFCTGFGLYIDNTLVAVGKSQEELEKILSETLELYSELYSSVKTADDIVSFNSSTEIRRINVPQNSVSSYEEIRSILGLDSLTNLSDILLADNSVSDEMTVSDISEMLPELAEITPNDISLALPAENVYPVAEFADGVDVGVGSGSVSDLGGSATLSFQSQAVEVVREVLAGEDEIIYDDSLAEGKKVLVRCGVYGIKESTYDVTYINGEEITRTLVSDEVIKEPVSKQYKVGTKKTNVGAKATFVPADPGSTEPVATGTYILPSAGTITSTFEGRTLFGEYEFHGAVDIANSMGTSVYASDGGVVTFAGWYDSYGNCIIINHGNGIETLYAHLSAFSVQVGDSVGQGWKIGEMGATGRVTGTHVHFEVRSGGQRVDPMLYVNQ